MSCVPLSLFAAVVGMWLPVLMLPLDTQVAGAMPPTPGTCMGNEDPKLLGRAAN
jgi:hypothetical protein